MRLSSVVHDLPTKLWCGPAVVSAIAGIPTSEATKLIRRHRRRRKQPERVIGTTHEDLEAVLRNVGYWTEVSDVSYRSEHPTFRTWLDESRPYKQAFIVMLGRDDLHWVAVTRTRFVDNSTIDPIPVEEAPFRRLPVHAVISVGKQSD